MLPLLAAERAHWLRFARACWRRLTAAHSASDIHMLDTALVSRRRSKQILLMQTGYGAPQFLLRPLPVAEMSCVSARQRGGGTWCVMSGRWSIVGLGFSGPGRRKSLGTSVTGSKSECAQPQSV